jgi:hypothetical protein
MQPTFVTIPVNDIGGMTAVLVKCGMQKKVSSRDAGALTCILLRMDFTEIYKQTTSLVAFSSGAHFILNAVQDRLIVRRADTFQITRTWLLDASPSPTQTVLSKPKPQTTSPPSESWITHAGWSCDSEYLLGACAKKGVVHVFQLRDEQWSARIDSGAEGLVKAEWAPDGRTILCFSEWGVCSLLLFTSSHLTTRSCE